MTPEILAWLGEMKERHHLSPARVLDIGSRNVNGSPRRVFGDAAEYVGVDREPGPGVDLVTDVHDLHLGETFDLVLCCEMLEHDRDPLETIWVMRDHLADGGHMVITSPAQGFKQHRYPRDYWRFMPDAYRDLFFRDMDLLELTRIPGPTWCSLGRKHTKKG